MECVGINSQVTTRPRPGILIREYLVISSDLHGEPELLLVGPVGQRRSDVIERSESNLILGEQQRVVLSVGVGSGDEPVPDQRIGESADSVIRYPWWHHPAQ